MGTYTEIVEVVAPGSARAGERVDIEVRVKNLHTGPIYITVIGIVDDLALYFGSVYYSVPAGGIQSFYDVFVMPEKSVRLSVASFYWTGTKWYRDDERQVDITLAELVPGFSQFTIKDYVAV
jgi:hypothetical protein